MIELGILFLVVAVFVSVVLSFYTWSSCKKELALAAAARDAFLSKAGSPKGSAADMTGVQDLVRTIQDELGRIDQVLDGVQKSVQDSGSIGGAALKNIEGSIEGVRDYLAEKSREHQRLQEGYDYTILKNFCKQIIRCVYRIESRCAEGDSNERLILEGIRVDLLDLLDRNGVERFEPEIGEDYSDLRAQAEVLSHKEFTDDDKKVGCVADVVRSGFRYVYNDDQMRLIMPAQVKIYARERG